LTTDMIVWKISRKYHDNCSKCDTSMKFGGFKGQMMLYPKKHLDMKKIQYGG